MKPTDKAVTTSRKRYQAEYYRRNRERLLNEKARRYQESAEYRQEHADRGRRHYWLKRRPAMDRAWAKVEPLSVEDPRPAAYVTVPRADGSAVETPVYTTWTLAEALNRSPQTLALWERRGVIPPPAIRARDLEPRIIRGRNPRLYTLYELRILRDCAPLLRQPREARTHAAFAREVAARFSELDRGVPRV